MREDKARMFLREAEAFLQSARILRDAEAMPDGGWFYWANRNPIAFLLLHATELSLKAVTLIRGKEPGNSHDIVALARLCSKPSDRTFIRRAYASVRALGEQRVRDKWSGVDSEYADAGLQLELEKVRLQPVQFMRTFKLLGALGQSEMVKIEFGEVVEKWWHGARYPRHGITSYPDFDACVLICREIIHVAKLELNP